MTEEWKASDRSQVVLLAAVAVAVALVPMVLAYVQLGYHADVAGPEPDRAIDAERTLQGAVVEATDGIAVNYSWSQRSGAVSTVRDRLAPALESLNRSSVASGTAYRVTYNETLADEWRAANCPSGPDRQFERCRVDRGIVVQGRAGRTHVLAVAFDVQITTQRGDWFVKSVTTALGDNPT